MRAVCPGCTVCHAKSGRGFAAGRAAIKAARGFLLRERQGTLAVPAHASSVRICFIVPVLPPAGERPGRPARGRCNPTCRQLHGSHLLSVASAYARRVSHLHEICIQNVSVQTFLPRRCHAGRCGAQKCGLPRFRGRPQNFSISGGQRQRVPYSAFCISMWGWPQSRNTSPTGENPRAA